MLTLIKFQKNKSQEDAGGEDGIEFIISGEDAPEGIQATKKTLCFIATLVEFFIVSPRLDSLRVGRHNRLKSKLAGQRSRLVALVGAVHDQRAFSSARAPKLDPGGQPFFFHFFEQIATAGPVARLSRREQKRYGLPIICGHQMNFGVPSSARFSD